MNKAAQVQDVLVITSNSAKSPAFATGVANSVQSLWLARCSMKAPQMAKDRNTMAKRQREAEKRDKAVKKRQKREKRQIFSTLKSNNVEITDDEMRVLQIFSRYLMTAGKMLCLSGNELDSHSASLGRLVDAGMLVAETFQGGYSLTVEGFDAMKKLSGDAR